MGEYLSTSHFTVLHGESQSPSLRIFEAGSTPLEQESLGRLFIFSEVHSDATSPKEDLLSFLEEDIKRNYYGTDLFDPERAFENALQKTNQELHELIAQSGSDWIQHYHILVAVFYRDQLFLSHIGQGSAFLVHQGKILDILDSAGAPHLAKINPLRVFSNIISGSVSVDDTIMFCNTAILDYFSLEKIRKTIVEKTPEEIAKHFQTLLEETNSPNDFAALFVHVVQIPEKSPEPLPSQKEPVTFAQRRREHIPEASMDALIQKEQRTLHLLNPSFLTNLRTSALKFFQRPPKAKTVTASDIPEESSTSDLTLSRRARTRHQLHRTPSVVSRISDIIKNTGLAIAGFLSRIPSIFRRSPSRSTRAGHPSFPSHSPILRSQPHRFGMNFFQGFRNISRRRKILLLLVLAFLIFFAQSVLRSDQEKDSQLSNKESDTLLAEAKENVSEAENVLIYENEDDARTFLEEAQDRVDQINDSDNNDLSQDVDALQKKITDLLNRVNHVTTIESPTVIADFSKTFPNAKITTLSRLNNTLYATNSEDGNVIQTLLSSKEISDVGTISGNVRVTRALPWNNKLLLLTAQNTLLQYDPASQKVQSVSIAFGQDNPTLIAMGFFNSRLYIADQTNQQIYRHNPLNDGFSVGSAWLSTNTDFSNISDLAIDSAIYLLEKNGKITKYFQGAPDTTFTSTPFSPETSNAIRFIASDALTHIYVLDQKNQRLIVMDKTGKMTAQIASGEFKKLSDIVVDETQKKAYLLSGAKIFEVSLAI